MKNVKITKDFKGAYDGITVIEYKKGEVLGVPEAFFNLFVPHYAVPCEENSIEKPEVEIEKPEIEIETTEVEKLETKFVEPEENKMSYTEDELNIMKPDKLKAIAKSLDVERWYNKKKSVLIKEILKKV